MKMNSLAALQTGERKVMQKVTRGCILTAGGLSFAGVARVPVLHCCHPLSRLPHACFPVAVCERVGTPGEALLEAFKPRPYTELVGGKTMAQVGPGVLCWRASDVGSQRMNWMRCAACCSIRLEGTAADRTFRCDPLLWPTSAVAAHPLLQAGCIPILHMRGFQKGGQLPADLVADIQGRHAA